MRGCVIEVWLSLVERYVRDVEAGGSNPLTSTRDGHLSGTLCIAEDVCFFIFLNFCGGAWAEIRSAGFGAAEETGMQSIYIFSGPCGSGKTTLSKAYAQHLADQDGARPIYLIHGDDFHAGFLEPSVRKGRAGARLPWPEILQFNWACMLGVADEALCRGLDVVADYVVEDELPLVRRLAEAHGARLYYIVLTASAESIERRLCRRGDAELVERALFLKDKLEHAPENQGRLLDNTGLSAAEQIEALQSARFLL